MKINSLKNKRILITGITGFVGKALSNRLKSLGAIVYGISRSVNNDTRNLNADILSYPKINNFIKDSKIQICFHLASASLVEEGQRDPYRTFKVNTESTLNILESARNNNFEKIIIASTSHVYGGNKVPYIESYTPKPTRPYETSKACTDIIAQSYAASFNLPVLIPRFVNIYGPGDLNFQRLIPKTIKSVLENCEPEMWGGQAVRDYLFIDDAIDAYIRLATLDMNHVGGNLIFNFGSNNRISVKNIMEKIIKISGKKLKIRRIPQERQEEIESQYVSSKKAKQLLGWEAKIDLALGLKKTVAWYSEFLYNKSQFILRSKS